MVPSVSTRNPVPPVITRWLSPTATVTTAGASSANKVAASLSAAGSAGAGVEADAEAEAEPEPEAEAVVVVDGASLSAGAELLVGGFTAGFFVAVGGSGETSAVGVTPATKYASCARRG